MIPDFKTFIKESVWKDIHKRSTGETIRKEDSINNYDILELYKYLIDHYEVIGDSIFNIHNDTYSQKITIPIISKFLNSVIYNLSFNYEDEILYFSNQIQNLEPEFIDKMKKKYYMVPVEIRDKYTRLEIYPSKNELKITNDFLIEVLEFILKNAPKEKLILKKKQL